MKWIPRAAALLLICLGLTLPTGCMRFQQGTDAFKDKIVSGLDSMLESFSLHALTRGSRLQGERTFGGDTYTGSYRADYRNFSGEEVLFGGTKLLERAGGAQIKVTYRFDASAGSGALSWKSSCGSRKLAIPSSQGEAVIELSEGDQYLILTGDNLSGSLTVTAENLPVHP